MHLAMTLIPTMRGLAARCAVSIACVGAFAACAAQTVATPGATGGPAAAPAAPQALSCAPSGRVAIPSGIDISRLVMLDEGKQYKVYTSVEANDERDPSKSMFPAALAQRIDLSPSSLTTMFTNTILASRRFEVFDMRPNVVAEFSDVLITAKILDASQVLRESLDGGRRVSESKVILSVQVKNMYTGRILMQSDAQVEGRTGATNNDRVIVTSADDVNSPAIRQLLDEDFKNALRRAFSQATTRLTVLLRPLAQVVSADGCAVDLFGGSRNGVQQDDELVIFRTQKQQRGESLMMTNTRAVALVRCGGVGVENSQCEVIRAAPGFQPQEGDYAAITDESLTKPRLR